MLPPPFTPNLNCTTTAQPPKFHKKTKQQHQLSLFCPSFAHMTDAMQQQIELLTQQRELLMSRLQRPQPDAKKDEDASDRVIDAEALNSAVQAALLKATAGKSSEDNSRYQRTIDDLQSRLAAAEVGPPLHPCTPAPQIPNAQILKPKPPSCHCR